MSTDFEIAECMFEAARRWRTFQDTAARPGPAFPPNFTGLGHGSGEVVFAERCEACREEVFSTSGTLTPSEIDIVRHMMNSHGYRMDGRQFDNQNRLVGHA